MPIARLLGIKVVFTHHGPDYDRDKWGFFAKTMLKLGERMGTIFANEVIVISEVINDLLVRKYGRRDCHLITTEFRSLRFVTIQNILMNWGLRKESIFWVCVGLFLKRIFII